VSRDWHLYLEDIRKSLTKVGRYTRGLSAADFKADEKTRDAVLYNLQIIGEAAKHLPNDERAELGTIDWRRIAGFRNIVAHAYFGIDDAILWSIIQEKVPELQTALDKTRSQN
jgi:uncharacterized protein with HEPN domain